MVKYNELIPGRKYKLDHINVGKFVRRYDDVLVFLDSEHGEEGENEIDADEDDEYTEIKAKKAKTKTVSKQGGGKKRKSRRRSKRNKFSRIT